MSRKHAAPAAGVEAGFRAADYGQGLEGMRQSMHYSATQTLSPPCDTSFAICLAQNRTEHDHEAVLLLLQVLRVGEALLATQQARLLPELLQIAGGSSDTPGVQLLQVPALLRNVSSMQCFLWQENGAHVQVCREWSEDFEGSQLR